MQVADKPTAAQARAKEHERLQRFQRPRKVENMFGRQLRHVARQVGAIIRGYVSEGSIEEVAQLRETLNRYAELLDPWARAVVNRMANEVLRKEAMAWYAQGEEIGRALKQEIRMAPTGEALRKYLSAQVDLITSLPRQAAERVHRLTLEGITSGERADSIKQEILRTGKVTESRAMLIARTEVSRTASVVTMTRAQYVGSPGYIWRTAHDSDVRPVHRRLEGNFVKWTEPPVADESGMRYHAGMGPNCRCYPESVLPSTF